MNGSGKSTVLRIMAGVDTDFAGESRAHPGTKIGFLEQEPKLDPDKTVREVVEEGVADGRSIVPPQLIPKADRGIVDGHLFLRFVKVFLSYFRLMPVTPIG